MVAAFHTVWNIINAQSFEQRCFNSNASMASWALVRSSRLYCFTTCGFNASASREKRRLSRPWLGGRKSSSPQLDSRPNRLAQLVLVLLTGSVHAYNQPSPVRRTKYYHASHPLPQSAHPRHHDRDNDHNNTHTRAGRLPPAGLRAPAHTAPSRHARPTHAKPCAPASPWLCPWQRRRVHRRAHPWSWWWPWRHACKSARVRTRNHPAPA